LLVIKYQKFRHFQGVKTQLFELKSLPRIRRAYNVFGKMKSARSARQSGRVLIVLY